MTLECKYIAEPLLEFGHGQKVEHPQDGLFLYGPVKATGNTNLINVGVLGTPAGIALVKAWLIELSGPINVKNPNQLHSSPWPGFGAAFGTHLATLPLVEIGIPSSDIYNAIGKTNRFDAIRSAVEIFERAIKDHLRDDERRPDVWIVVIPEFVFKYGRPEMAGPKDGLKSKLISEKAAAQILRGGALFPEMENDARTYLFSKNFHHQLKAQLLSTDVVIQLVRDTTLDPSLELDRFGNPARSLQERARIAWNFSTTLYFKGARVQPWQLADVRPGVCYVGLVFKKDPSPAKQGEACCAAQMFLNSGNGVVFRGALGPWRSERTGEYHLGKEAAGNLIGKVIDQYVKDHGQPPTELFIHGRQRFTKTEWEGFNDQVPSSTKLAGVRIQQSQDLRLFRDRSEMPVLRGTAAITSPRTGYLWTTGYTPRLRTYPGFETPKPILVDINQGDGDIEEVMSDVLALTKINYNACDFSSGLPVTLKFADRVGDILTASPDGAKAPPLPFRFYI